MQMQRSAFVVALHVVVAGVVSISGCATSEQPRGGQAAMTRADSAPPMQAPERQPQEVKTPVGREPQQIQRNVAGPYVRVGLTYSKASGADFKEDNAAAPNCFLFSAGGGCGSTLSSLGSSVGIDVGVGYRINPLFRVDLSYGRRGGYNLQGWDTALTYFDPPVTSDAVMFNGFFDIPYVIADRVQPYVGLAIGRSSNKVDSINWLDPGPPSSNGTLNAGNTTKSTAYQFTLGAAITLTGKWILDLGYRYSDMGEFKKNAGPDQSGNFNGTGTTSSATGKLRANEFFANVRYDF